LNLLGSTFFSKLLKLRGIQLTTALKHSKCFLLNFFETFDELT
jgi:hypothetical protein